MICLKYQLIKMSFRIEEKISITKENLFIFYNFLTENKALNLFPSRNIDSIYFDNEYFQMFYDSEEGVVPRKKIRTRKYNNLNDYLLEKKISSSEGRFKISKKIIDPKDFYKFGLIDDTYGICKPKLRVFYERSYFKVLNFRVTIDTNIKFQKFSINNKFFENSISDEVVVEVKSNNILDYNDFQKKFPFTKIRFSKYSKGIASIYGY